MQRALTKMRRLVDRSEFTLANFQRDSRLPGQGGQNLLGPSQYYRRQAFSPAPGFIRPGSPPSLPFRPFRQHSANRQRIRL